MKSRRAQLLLEILEYVNAEDWQREDGFLVFGMDGYYKELLGEDAETAESADVFRRFANEIKTVKGKQALQKRMSLQSVNGRALVKPFVEYLNALTESERNSLIEDLRKDDSDRTQTNLADEYDDIDAALAQQAIEGLETSLERVVSIDPIDFQPISYNTAAYFEEAHKCYLSGRHIASAVLCRAVIEDALKKALDGNGILRKELPKEDSYFEALLVRALKLGVLDSSRLEMAKGIRLAGNKAAHDLSTFKTRYEACLPELVDNMRMILEDLSSGLASKSAA